MDGALDPFRITDKLEDILLDVMVLRLEARGKHWFFQKVLREYLDAMDIDSASTVLDIGCGTEWRHVQLLVERISQASLQE